MADQDRGPGRAMPAVRRGTGTHRVRGALRMVWRGNPVLEAQPYAATTADGPGVHRHDASSPSGGLGQRVARLS
jgi:hypothetical protein